MVESVSRRRAVGLKAMLFFSSFTIVGIFWYYNNRQIQTYDNRMGQSISTDTFDAEMKLESNAPSETLIYTDYTKILPEVKKVIDEDVKPIDAMMDTITRTFVQGESRSQVYLDYAEPPPKVHLYE